MQLSAGWFFLVGGLIGAFRVATAKKFHRSDFMNPEFLIAEEDKMAEVSITSSKRRAIVESCLLVAIIGIVLIQMDHNWRPLQTLRPNPKVRSE